MIYSFEVFIHQIEQMDHIIPFEIWKEMSEYLIEKSTMAFFQTSKLFLQWQPLKQFSLTVESQQDLRRIPLSVYRLVIHMKSNCRRFDILNICRCASCHLKRTLIALIDETLDYKEIKCNLNLMITKPAIKVECLSLDTTFYKNVNYLDCQQFNVVRYRKYNFHFLKFNTLDKRHFENISINTEFLEIDLDKVTKFPTKYVRAKYITFISQDANVKHLNLCQWFMGAQKFRFIGTVRMFHTGNIPYCIESYHENYTHFEWINKVN